VFVATTPSERLEKAFAAMQDGSAISGTVTIDDVTYTEQISRFRPYGF
jgi:hypothetical protein